MRVARNRPILGKFSRGAGNPIRCSLSYPVSVAPLTLLCLHSLDRVRHPPKPEPLPGDFPRVARHFFVRFKNICGRLYARIGAQPSTQGRLRLFHADAAQRREKLTAGPIAQAALYLKLYVACLAEGKLVGLGEEHM